MAQGNGLLRVGQGVCGAPQEFHDYFLLLQDIAVIHPDDRRCSPAA